MVHEEFVFAQMAVFFVFHFRIPNLKLRMSYYISGVKDLFNIAYHPTPKKKRESLSLSRL